MIATPARPHRLCAAAVATYASWPLIMVAYWTGVLESGVLPPDGDTVVIPIVKGFALTVLLSPVFALVLWASLRRYPGAVPLFARPCGARAWAWTAAYVLVLGAAAVVVVAACSLHVSGLLLLHGCAAATVLLQLRAATAHRSGSARA